MGTQFAALRLLLERNFVSSSVWRGEFPVIPPDANSSNVCYGPHRHADKIKSCVIIMSQMWVMGIMVKSMGKMLRSTEAHLVILRRKEDG